MVGKKVYRIKAALSHIFIAAMENSRTSYSTEEKMEMILSILSKKSSIQKIAKEKGIAATLISLWKKQALEAMEARFRPQPKGRPKSTPEVPAEANDAMKKARNEARSAKIKAAHLEISLRETREKLAAMEAQLQSLAAIVGCKVVKEVKPRGPRKPRKA